MAKPDLIRELNMIGAGTVVEGKIRSQGSVRIDGKVIGEVIATEMLAVGLSGEVEGNVTGKNIVIGGKVRGAVSAADKIVFESKSVVRGDVRATRLVIDEGAVFDGRVSMTEKTPLYEIKH
jgi:cytoskeletal protein CcmA (bactofilin family)